MKKNRFTGGDVVIMKRSSGYPLSECLVKIIKSDGDEFYHFKYLKEYCSNSLLLESSYCVFGRDLEESKSHIINKILSEI